MTCVLNVGDHKEIWAIKITLTFIFLISPNHLDLKETKPPNVLLPTFSLLPYQPSLIEC